MKRFVSIWFPYLITDWYVLQQTQLKACAFVVKGSDHGRYIVRAANEMAVSAGIHAGMTLADARAICPSLQDREDQPGLTEKLLKRMARWCIRFTPVAAVDLPAGIILDVTGCAHLWGGEHAYLTDIIQRIQTKGFQVKAAMADTIGAAWAAARFRSKSSLIHPEKHSLVLMSMPVECLRLPPGILQYLHMLGLRQLKDIIALPKNALQRRFGPQVYERLQQALGQTPEYIEPIIPLQPFSERLPCLEPVMHRAGIEIALQQLLQPLCERLQKESKGIRALIFSCYRADGKTVSLQVGTVSPTLHQQHLFRLFEMKLDTLAPGPGIEVFVLDAIKTDTYLPQQDQLWKRNTGITGPQLLQLLDRIHNKIPGVPIERYMPAEHYLPEKAFAKVPSVSQVQTCNWQLQRPRPVILLSAPERIEVTAPVPDYPPMMFRYKGKIHKVVRADGPERIEQEWWIQDGRHRDYYVVEDENGCRYWLFRSGHYDAEQTYRWFLHGYFA